MPLVSVIVPVYNAEAYLRRSLDSLLMQDFDKWEAICVDDGSQDGSASLLDEYAAADSRFVVIHQENAGVASARNQGLDKAREKYLVFLDADDWYAPEALGMYCQELQQEKVDIVCSAYIREYSDGRSPLVHAPYDHMPAGKHHIDRLSLEYVHCCGWGKSYRRKIVETYGLRFKGGMKMGEDVLFVYQYLAHCRDMALLPTPLYHHYCAVDSAIQRGARGGFPLDVYDLNMQVPLLASDYMRMVVPQCGRRREYGYFYLSYALRERDMWNWRTKTQRQLNRELMRRDLRYIIILARRSRSISAWFMLANYFFRPLWCRIKASIKYRLNKYLGMGK